MTQQTVSDQIPIEEKYRQQYQHFSRMNDLLYKLPVLFSAPIGGFWYFGYSIKSEDPYISVLIYIVASIFGLACWQVMCRFSLAINAYIKNINKMDGDELKISITQERSPSVVDAIKYLLIFSVVISLIVASYICIQNLG